MPRYAVLATETTGIPQRPGGFDKYYPPSKTEKYDSSRLISLSYQIYDGFKLVKTSNYLIKPIGFRIENTQFHGITQQEAEERGITAEDALTLMLLTFLQEKVGIIVAHNVKFHLNIIESEIYRIPSLKKYLSEFRKIEKICSMNDVITLECKDGFRKNPKLDELYDYFFHRISSGSKVEKLSECVHQMIKEELIDFD